MGLVRLSCPAIAAICCDICVSSKTLINFTIHAIKSIHGYKIIVTFYKRIQIKKKRKANKKSSNVLRFFFPCFCCCCVHDVFIICITEQVNK